MLAAGARLALAGVCLGLNARPTPDAPLPLVRMRDLYYLVGATTLFLAELWARR